MWKAKWIWKKQRSYNPRHQTVVARKEVRLGDIRRATMRVTADGSYRLYINGEWVNDGPCRSWPEHFQYDELDVTGYLRKGLNEIRIIARHWSVGTFHAIPQQAGLLAQLDVRPTQGKRRVFGTGASWEVAEARAWLPDTPKASIQMQPQEYYDARLEVPLRFAKAVVLFDATGGPWKGLNQRDVALMTRKPFSFRSFREANLVAPIRDLDFCMPAAELCNPGVIEANGNTGQACGMATVLELKRNAKVRFRLEGMRLHVDGRQRLDDTYRLQAGRHFLLAFVTDVAGHLKEKGVRIVAPPEGMRLVNPLDATYENPWAWIPFPECAFTGDDMDWLHLGAPPAAESKMRTYQETAAGITQSVCDAATFREHVGRRARKSPSAKMFVRDTHWPFMQRQPLGDARALVENPDGLMHDNTEMTIVRPSREGDVELVYDLGEQNCGYYDLELIADAGVEIDIFGIEHINPDGEIQHTVRNRNGVRYVTRQGVNRFLSIVRRSGRYLYITLRNQRSAVRIRKLQLIESTYPVNYTGSFRCSDARLEQVWDISARTLKLCMEDTFTDCPLYERTFWVGDSRNEAIFAYPVFGGEDIARRCIRIGAQSLERYPIVGCQIPSSWECLLPAWSFLWGISVWDYYFYSGDAEFVREMWPAVLQNLRGAETLCTDQGLFSGPFWNMFDWSGADQNQKTVLHNTMFIIGAIDAALQCARVLGDTEPLPWLRSLRRRLVRAVNKLWNPKKHAYADSIHENGAISPTTSQHTSFLAILYDIIEKQNAPHALSNMLKPPKGMVEIGSPFAILYHYEALDKVGQDDEIIRSIYENYLPMLEADATTVWEVFPGSASSPKPFPTRSHCHAWSSAPLHFLPRVVLGIRQTRPGGAAFDISPRLSGLTHAEGTVATAQGPLTVAWRLEGKTLDVRIDAPEGVKTRFVRNETHKGLRIVTAKA